jgi:hypothetical protein
MCLCGVLQLWDFCVFEARLDEVSCVGFEVRPTDNPLDCCSTKRGRSKACCKLAKV